MAEIAPANLNSTDITPGVEPVEEDAAPEITPDATPEITPGVEPVEEDAAPELPQNVDIAMSTNPGHSFSVIGSGGIETIHGESSSSDSCGEFVTYIKNEKLRTKECASDDFNAKNLCHRRIPNETGLRVWDVCCDQCEELKNAI